MDPIDLVGGFYTDESLPWSCQDTVNYIPVQAEVAGTRTPTKLVDAPGMKPFLWVGHYAEDAVPSGPIRGMHDVEGKLFIVCGGTLYQISNKNVAIPLGTIPGTGRVSMAHNQITGGNQLIVVNGSSGYVYNTVSEVFERVVDASYPGAAIAEFIDGYLMQLEPFGRFLLFSDLADALAYNALDRFEAETAPDMTVGLAIVHQEVWALGERSIDVFENVGTAQGTFRNKGVSIQKGCGARWSTALIDNGLAWLGSDGVIYHARSYDPVRISTRAIEVALAECSPADRKNAFAMVWEDRGHAVYYITVPNGPTFGYDFSTGLWHRRASYHPVADVSGRWRLNDLVRSNSRWIGGDYQDGRLYALDWDYMLEGVDTPHVRERTSPAAHNNQNRFTVDHVEIIFDTGGPETVPVEFPYQPVGPTITGNAPDGTLGEPFSFAYTTAPGSSPIDRTVLMNPEALPDGWAWDEATATVTTDEWEVARTITLRMRVVDENGLSDDHTDTFKAGYEYQFVADNGGLLMFGTDADLWEDSRSFTSGGIMVTWGQRVLMLSPDGAVYTDNYGATATSVAKPWPGTPAAISPPCKTSSGRIYVAAGDSSVYYTDDGGATWGSIPTSGTSIVGVAGDDDEIIAIQHLSSTYYVSTNGTFFGSAKSAPGGIVSVSYGKIEGEAKGMFMFTRATAANAYWSDDSGNSLTSVTTPDPGGDAIEAYAAFRTSTGAWLMSNRINTNSTDELIARSPDGKEPFVYVPTPSLNMDGGSVCAFAERGGVIVSYALTDSTPVMTFLKSVNDGAEFDAVAHAYPGSTGRPRTIAAFPEGDIK